MTSLVGGCITGFLTYETNKSVVVKSWSVGITYRIVQLLIITYFVCYVFIYEKAYQVSDTAMESSVMTKVKGFGRVNSRTMDVADYIFPPQGSAVFCIMTKVVVTENQFQGNCSETESGFSCSSDENCTKHMDSILGNGKISGICNKKDNKSTGYCQIQGWCPAENDRIQTDPMLEFVNFTIFIKNSVRFPLFNVNRGNFPDTVNVKNCTYNKSNPLCPIFRVGDVLANTKPSPADVTKLAEKGGIIGINIEWMCDLDLDVERCLPEYSFTKLDAPFENSSASKGYNFRFAKYYKTEDGTEYRTLHKVYAVRFDVLVTGGARKFSLVPTVINVVAALTSIGMGTVICDIILLNFLKGAEQYKAKKFEEVSDKKMKESITPSSGSQEPLKRENKSSSDSGAIFLSTFD